MAFQPDFTLLLPLAQFRLRKRVSQSPSHEDEDVSLLPMGKEVFGDFYLAVVVEIEAGDFQLPILRCGRHNNLNDHPRISTK